ncbi:MAG TPA: glycosyltransferase [Myxococcales bacterium]|nr:glycosyltransferase [Myxococcales bacterium]
MGIDVSVVIPTFRRPAQLGEAIRSALAQEGVSVEVHVNDDSPEGSGAAAVEAIADPRVHYQKMEVPTGGSPSRVRNTTWPQTRGTFIHFLDDDDRVEPGAYAAMAAALNARPGTGVAFGRIAPFGDDPQVLAQQQAYFVNAAKRARLSWALRSRRLMVANMLFKPTVLVCSAALLRRECVAGAGGFDEEIKLVEDVDFFLRAIREFGCVFLDRVVLNYRTGAPSLMHAQKDASGVIRSYERIFSKYRARWGAAELTALKLVARTALRWT